MSSNSRILVEACVGSFADALAAAENGADRLEFCQCLEVGGLTPDFDPFQKLRAAIDIPIVTLIRPRAGDFHYPVSEWRMMIQDAKQFLDHGADGIVFGALDGQLNVDPDRSMEMIGLVRRYPGKAAVFHRAFDESRDIWESWNALRELGVDRILTGGGRGPAECGSDNLREMVAKSRTADSLPSILVGGSVRAGNVVDLIRQTKVRQIHTASSKDKQPVVLDVVELRRLIEAIREFDAFEGSSDHCR